jgi:hypothetical protein
MGDQAGPACGAARGRCRIHDGEIYGSVHQCVARLARRAFAESPERRSFPAAGCCWGPAAGRPHGQSDGAGRCFQRRLSGSGPDDPQLRNRYGVNFRINDPPLILGEAQFLWNGKKGDPGLDGKFKLSAWRHFGTFSDQCFDGAGVSLADSASNGMPGLLRGDFGFYSVVEQKYIGSLRPRIVASASSRGRPTVRPTETSSTIARTPGSNSSSLPTDGPRTSSAFCGGVRSCLASRPCARSRLPGDADARLAHAQLRSSGHGRLPVRGACRMVSSRTFSSLCTRAAAQPIRSRAFRVKS